MRINVGSPYNCIKIALYYALGTIVRPTYFHADSGQVTMRNETEEFIFEFEDLNFDYANKIAIEDIPSFGQEEFGKFFYEYGRVLFANLIIAMTHLDWDALGEKARTELKFVADYYDELLKLHNRAGEVLEAFCDTIKLTKDEKAPYYDFLSAAGEIIHIKQANSFSDDNPDIKNTKILSLAYTAAWFSIIGYLLIFCHKTDVDGLSRLPDAAGSAREAKVLIKSIANSQEEDSKIINICSLIFAFFHINRLYLISSGLSMQDPLLELLGKFSSHLMDLINDENDLIIIDSDLILANTNTGSSIAAFTDKFDPLADIARFTGTGIIKIDTANIWEFGKEYLYMYRESREPDGVSLPSLIEPCMVKYIDKNASLASYVNSDNIEIEKSFLFIKNMIKGIDKEKIGVVCPGTILQLTLIAATYRTLEKSSLFSRLDAHKKLLVQVGIDIIDILIVVLYQLWFLSGKFFIQPSRPHYSDPGAVSTLELLREEVLLILEDYFEFVRFGGRGKNPEFEEITRQRLIRHNQVSTQDIVNKFHPVIDEDSYITECGKHGVYTIAYSALCNNIDSRFTINYLSQYGSKVPVNEQTIRLLSGYVEGTSTAYTDIPMIDAMMASYKSVLERIEEKPENFTIVVYALLFETIEQLLFKNNQGNYFNFSQAENITTSYKVESIVSELVRKPLQNNLGSQGEQQKRLAVW